MATDLNSPAPLITASRAAAFCAVDLKTIHNWCDQGKIRFFRTPGRHIRIRTSDLVAFLTEYSYPIPDELRAARPLVRVLDDSSAAAKGLSEALSVKFEPITAADEAELLLLAAHATAAIIVTEGTSLPDVGRFVSALHRHKGTKTVPVFIRGGSNATIAAAVKAKAIDVRGLSNDDLVKKVIATLTEAE